MRGEEVGPGGERCVEGRAVEGRLHMKVSFETNISFKIIDQSVYFLVKFNVWVHLATVDSLDPGEQRV